LATAPTMNMKNPATRMVTTATTSLEICIAGTVVEFISIIEPRAKAAMPPIVSTPWLVT